MAIRALYEIKDAPLALIVDMYKNAMVPSIDEKSRDGYIVIRNFTCSKSLSNSAN